MVQVRLSLSLLLSILATTIRAGIFVKLMLINNRNFTFQPLNTIGGAVNCFISDFQVYVYNFIVLFAIWLMSHLAGCICHLYGISFRDDRPILMTKLNLAISWPYPRGDLHRILVNIRHRGYRTTPYFNIDLLKWRMVGGVNWVTKGDCFFFY